MQAPSAFPSFEREHGDTVTLEFEAISPLMPADASTRQDLLRLASSADDPYARTTALHITASAYIICPAAQSVLIRWHSVVRNWIQVGGHVDADDMNPLDAALREAQEETGLPDLIPLCTPTPWVPLQAVTVVVPSSPKERSHQHLDLRYLLRTLLPEASEPEHEDNPVRWITYEAAESEVSDHTVLAGIRMIATLSERTDRFRGNHEHVLQELLQTQ